MIEEFIQACMSGKAYDFICNNYWRMSREDLATVCKEAIYVHDCDKEIAESLVEWER